MDRDSVLHCKSRRNRTSARPCTVWMHGTGIHALRRIPDVFAREIRPSQARPPTLGIRGRVNVNTLAGLDYFLRVAARPAWLLPPLGRSKLLVPVLVKDVK